MLEARRARGRTRLLPGVLARARRSRQPEVAHRQHPEGRRRHRPASHRGGVRALRADRDDGRRRSARRSVAEMVKLLENTFRAVNIGLVNELALMCRQHGHRRLGSDRRGARPSRSASCRSTRAPAWAGTASRSIRSICSWKARQSGFESRFIELAGHVNASMPRYVVDRVERGAQQRRQAAQGLAGAPVRRSRTSRTSTTTASRPRSTSRSCWCSAARSSATATRTCRSRRARLRDARDGGAGGARARHRLRRHRHQSSRLRLRRSAAHAPLVVDTRNALKGRSDDRTSSDSDRNFTSRSRTDA